MNSYQKAAREQMQAAGITVVPAAIGGFEALNLPGGGHIWATTEIEAWAGAWSVLKISNAGPHGQKRDLP